MIWGRGFSFLVDFGLDQGIEFVNLMLVRCWHSRPPPSMLGWFVQWAIAFAFFRFSFRVCLCQALKYESS